MADFSIDIGKQFSLGDSFIGDVPEYSEGGILSVLSVVIKNIYVLAAVVLLFFLFAGGLGMIINAGNAEKQKQSSKTLTSALTGFGILIAAYWIIKIIEVVFGLNIFALPGA